MWDATRRRPYTKEASNLSKGFRDNAEGYFRFITEPDVVPTNNPAGLGTVSPTIPRTAHPAYTLIWWWETRTKIGTVRSWKL